MTRLHILHPHVPRGPLTRAECREWIYPCRLRACRHNLGHVDKNAARWDGGNVHMRAQALPVEGCALDVAEAGPSPHEAIGSALGISRSRALQIEQVATMKLARKSAAKVLQREMREHDERGWVLPDHGGEE